MSNPYFRFKQFTIYQDRTAMKISTDGIVLGACCEFGKAKKVLDVGTGTGLLSLMAAQKSLADITAVEINQDAYNQAIENVEKSKFASRVKIVNGDFIKLFSDSAEHFDYIVSNPPFFRNSLKSSSQGRSIARHEDSLPFEKFVPTVARLLTSGGTFSVILPESERLYFNRLCIANGMHICGKTIVKSFENSDPLRVILHFSKSFLQMKQEVLVIYSTQNIYTQQFKNLVKDFYINV
ncbi:MAG: tRNA (adenine(22)-N(1))-methyltransferase TrmK [Bacteroidales bacterium]|nr:tRNA (adenine(22)-N(1))-methyltransferase TrmK [Bacteroidales bacterium]